MESLDLLVHRLGADAPEMTALLKAAVRARTAVSSVTTAWGVAWDEEMIARDLMQNFFDANQGRLGEVVVTVLGGKHVLVRAPASFPLESLLYLGSEKGEGDVGQYGEGFKAAAMCLLRDFNVTPLVFSGGRMVRLCVSSETAPNTPFHPLVYDFFELGDAEPEGTALLLPNAPPKLREAMRHGMSHFLWEGNPLLGKRLWREGRGDFALYEATTASGHIFYQNLRRGEVPQIPLVLVIGRTYREIEKKTKSDRDRNAFGGELLQTFYRIFARSGVRGDARSEEAKAAILEKARPLWESGAGHPLLEQLAQVSVFRGVSPLFAEGYFARSFSNAPAEQLRCGEWEAAQKAQGDVALPAYFEDLGAPSARVYFREQARAARAELRETQCRRPTSAEGVAVRLLTEVLAALAPELAEVFARRHVSYTVGVSEAVLGSLRQDRAYRSVEVFLAESLFREDFAAALATFLHEHAHIFGYDGSRGFTDALTQLLEMLVRCRGGLDAPEARWEAARGAILSERESGGASGVINVSQRLADMEAGELRSLLRRLPSALVERALETKATPSPL